MTESIEIKVSQIRTDGGTQPRAQLNYITVAEYAESIEDGATFPPVEVMYDGSDYWLWDGFHRLDAHKKAGCTAIRANVKQGTRRDAVLASVGANNSHGLRRTNDDKRRAVMTLLNDAEWVKWSDREIARRCAVGNNLVSEMRKSILSSDDSMNNGRTFVHPKTGQPTTMNTTNIGKAVTPPMSTPRLEPKLADSIIQSRPSSTFVAPVAGAGSYTRAPSSVSKVVHAETRYAVAPPIRDDEEFDEDMADEYAEDVDGYDYQGIEPITMTDTLTERVQEDEELSSDEYYTPEYIIDAARDVLGEINLDPASCERAQDVVQADTYYDKEDNGLNRDWLGKVWLNPPFSKPQPFVMKLIDEYEAENIEAAIILVNNSTETRWGQALLSRYPVCFVGANGERRSRISFWRQTPEEPEKSNRYSQMIFYLGKESQKFTNVFSQFGPILERKK